MSQDRVGHGASRWSCGAPSAGTGPRAGDAGSSARSRPDGRQGRSAVGARTVAKGFPADFSRGGLPDRCLAPGEVGKSARTAVTASRQNVAEAVSESLPTLVRMCVSCGPARRRSAPVPQAADPGETVCVRVVVALRRAPTPRRAPACGELLVGHAAGPLELGGDDGSALRNAASRRESQRAGSPPCPPAAPCPSPRRRIRRRRRCR